MNPVSHNVVPTKNREITLSNNTPLRTSALDAFPFRNVTVFEHLPVINDWELAGRYILNWKEKFAPDQDINPDWYNA